MKNTLEIQPGRWAQRVRLGSKWNQFNPNILGLVTDAYNANDAANVSEIYYQKTGELALNVFIPTGGNKIAKYPIFVDLTGFILSSGHSLGIIANDYAEKLKKNLESYTGTWSLSSPNAYASVVGSTMTVSFTGTKVVLQHLSGASGGVWRFVLDGDSENSVDISTWNDTTIQKVQDVIFEGITDSEHIVVGTFIGDDPLHVPSGGAGTSRGWVRYDNGSYPEDKSFVIYETGLVYTEQVNMIPVSVVEFAYKPKKFGATYDAEFFPYHGFVNMTPVSRIIKINGVVISDWTADSYLKQCEKIEVTAEYIVFNSTEPTDDLLKVNTYYKVDKYGYYVDYTIEALQKINIDLYGFMLPVHRDFATLLTDNLNNTYSLTGNDTVRTELADGENIRSMRVSSSIEGLTTYNITAAFVNTAALRIGKADKGFPAGNNALFIINNLNNANTNKIYCSTFRGSVMETGEKLRAKHIYYIGGI